MENESEQATHVIQVYLQNSGLSHHSLTKRNCLYLFFSFHKYNVGIYFFSFAQHEKHLVFTVLTICNFPCKMRKRKIDSGSYVRKKKSLIRGKKIVRI